MNILNSKSRWEWFKAHFDYVCVERLLSCMPEIELWNSLGFPESTGRSFLKSRIRNYNWVNTWEELSDEEKLRITQMITANKVVRTEDDEQIILRISNRNKNDKSAVVFIKSFNQIRVIFDMPVFFIKRVISQDEQRKLGFDERGLELLERHLAREIKYPILKEYNLLGDYYVVVSDGKHQAFSERATKSGLGYEEYCMRVGLGKYLNRDTYNTYEKYRLILKEKSLGDNVVFLESTSKEYSRMYQFAHRRGFSINYLINSLGFSRSYEENAAITRPEPFYESSINDESRQKLLEELRQIQSEPIKDNSIGEKLTRNRRLVSTLKKLYNNRCQICTNDDGIPFIERSDGSYYSEVHHIKPLSNFGKQEEETYDIDSYLNVVVVCPHHHMFIHYHHGGFHILNWDKKGQPILVSDRGSKLVINKNYHLENPNS